MVARVYIYACSLLKWVPRWSNLEFLPKDSEIESSRGQRLKEKRETLGHFHRLVVASVYLLVVSVCLRVLPRWSSR